MAFGPSAALVLAVVVGVLLHAGSAAPSDGDPGGVYFPLRSVELKVYVDAKTGNLLPPPTGVILSPWLFSDAGVVEAAGVTYRLTDPASPAQSPNLPWLSVDAKTGLLKVKAQRVLTDNGARRRHVVWLDARTASRAPAHRAARPFMVPSERARLNITITFELLQEDRPCVNKLQGLAVAPEDPCHYCHDSCFLNNAELQIWENKPAVLVAPLGHVHADVQCGDRHQYTLKNGTEHFEILDSGLHTRGPLDRDALFNASAADSQRGPGPLVALAVECRTSWGTTEERVIPVHVLDEDDNAPVLEKDEKLEFNFTTEASLARGAHILVKDMDSRAANRFGELQVLDPSGVVAHKKLEFEGTHGGVQHTLVSIRLQVKDPMEAHYNVTLTLTDLTLKESDGASKDLRLSATLWGPPLTPPVAMSSSKTADSKPGPASRRRRASDQTHDHPDSVTAVPAADDYAVIPRSASVWTNAARYSRLLALGALNDSLKYQLGTGSPAWAGVTEGAGILYVSDPRALQATTEPHVVRVEALSDRGVPTVGYAVNVTVKTAKGRPCAVLANETCGQHISKKDCTNSCGSGSQGECTWREFQPSNVVTRNFSTCTPHADTCPDFVCDPLELLDPKICPQDCTGASF